jgi:hypothetical protein
MRSFNDFLTEAEVVDPIKPEDIEKLRKLYPLVLKAIKDVPLDEMRKLATITMTDRAKENFQNPVANNPDKNALLYALQMIENALETLRGRTMPRLIDMLALETAPKNVTSLTVARRNKELDAERKKKGY